MITYRSRHSGLFKSIAAGVMCLFLANQIVWAHPTGALKPPGLDDPELRDEVLDELWKRRYEVHEGNRLTTTPDGAEALPETIADLPAIWAVSPKDKRRSLRIANVQLERAGFEDNTKRMVNIISKLSELGDDVPDIVLFPEMIDIVMSASDRVVKERHRLIADIVAQKKIAVGYCVYCADPLDPKGKAKVYYHIIKPAEDNGVEEEIFEKEAFTREGRKIHLKEGCDAGLFICSEMNSLVVEGATPETLQAYANNINGASAVLIPSSVVPAGARHWAQAVFNRFGVPVVASNATVGPYVPDGYGSGQSFFISNNGQIVKIPGVHEEAILIADVTKGRAEPDLKARPALDVFLEEHYERGAIYSLSHIKEEGDYAGRLKEIRAGLEKAFIPVRRDGKSLFEYIEESMPVMRDGRPEEGLEFQICVAEDGQDIDPLPFDVDNPQQAARAHISNGRLTIIYTRQELERNEVWVTVDGKVFSVSCARFAVAMAAHEFDSRSEKGEKALAGIADPAAAQIKLGELERYRIELQNSILTSEAGDIPKAFQNELAALTFKAEFSLRGRDYAGKNEKRRKGRRRRKRHEEARRRFLEGGPTDIPQQPTRPAFPTQDADRPHPDMARRRLATDRAIDILQGRIPAINQRVIDQLPQQPPQTPGSQYSIPDDIWNEYWAIFEEIADIDEDVPELRALREELARPARSPGAIMRVLESLFLDGDRLLIFYSRQYPHKDWNVVNLPFLSVCEAGHIRNELVSIAGLQGHIFAVFSTDTIVPNCLGYPISTGVYRDIEIEGGTLVVISTEELGEVFGRYYEARLSIARSGQLPAEMQSGIPDADVSMVEFLRRTWPDDEFRPYAEAPDAGTNAGFQNFAAAYLRDYVESVAQHEIVHVLTPRSNIAERCAYLHDLQAANRWRYLRLFNMVEALTRPGTHSREHTQTSGFMIYGLIPIIMQRRPNDELSGVSGQLQTAVASKAGQPQVAVFRLLPLLPDDIFQPEYTRVFAELAQEQPRELGGRFDKKEGGSVEDIVVAAYRHPADDWTIKELRAQSELISNVSEDTNRRDVREARQRGWIEPVEGSRHRYRLTQAGRDYVVERQSFTLAVNLDEVYLQEFQCEDAAQYRDRTPSQVRIPRSYSAANVDFKIKVGKTGLQPKLETESIGPTSSRLGSGKIGNCDWGDAVFMKLESEDDILGTAFAEGCDVIAGTVFIKGEPYLFEYHRTVTNEKVYDFLNWLLELDDVSNGDFECYILTERNTEQIDKSGSSLLEVIERLEGKHEGISIKISKLRSMAQLGGFHYMGWFATAVTVSRYGVVERTLLYVLASAMPPVEWLKSSPRFHAFRSAAAPSIVQSSPTHLAEGKRSYDSGTPFSDGIADGADASHAQPHGQPRGLGGRFGKKEGGSVEDIVIAAYRHFPTDYRWSISELREKSELISSVSERTNQRDVAEALGRGLLEPGIKSNTYRLTHEGWKYAFGQRRKEALSKAAPGETGVPAELDAMLREFSDVLLKTYRENAVDFKLEERARELVPLVEEHFYALVRDDSYRLRLAQLVWSENKNRLDPVRDARDTIISFINNYGSASGLNRLAELIEMILYTEAAAGATETAKMALPAPSSQVGRTEERREEKGERPITIEGLMEALEREKTRPPTGAEEAGEEGLSFEEWVKNRPQGVVLARPEQIFGHLPATGQEYVVDADMPPVTAIFGNMLLLEATNVVFGFHKRVDRPVDFCYAVLESASQRLLYEIGIWLGAKADEIQVSVGGRQSTVGSGQFDGYLIGHIHPFANPAGAVEEVVGNWDKFGDERYKLFHSLGLLPSRGDLLAIISEQIRFLRRADRELLPEVLWQSRIYTPVGAVEVKIDLEELRDRENHISDMIILHHLRQRVEGLPFLCSPQGLADAGISIEISPGGDFSEALTPLLADAGVKCVSSLAAETGFSRKEIQRALVYSKVPEDRRKSVYIRPYESKKQGKLVGQLCNAVRYDRRWRKTVDEIKTRYEAGEINHIDILRILDFRVETPDGRRRVIDVLFAINDRELTLKFLSDVALTTHYGNKTNAGLIVQDMEERDVAQAARLACHPSLYWMFKIGREIKDIGTAFSHTYPYRPVELLASAYEQKVLSGEEVSAIVVSALEGALNDRIEDGARRHADFRDELGGFLGDVRELEARLSEEDRERLRGDIDEHFGDFIDAVSVRVAGRALLPYADNAASLEALGKEIVAQPQVPKLAQEKKRLPPSEETPPQPPKGDPANLYDATENTYLDIEYIAGRAGVAISTAAKDLRLLYLAGVLERLEITRNKRKMYKYRRTQKLQRIRGWKRQRLISGFLNDIFNRDNPKNRGNVTRYREGGEKDALIAALRQNFVVRKKMHREREGETPNVLSIYEKDARTTGEIISEVKSLQEKYGEAAAHKYILTINDRKTNAYQRAAVRNMASSIAEKMGAEIGFARADDRDEPTFIFECRDAEGNTIGKAKVEEYASAISLDRTVAILNLGLGASSIPHKLNKESIGHYMPLLKCVNDQYRRIDVLGRDLIRFLDMPPGEMSLRQIDEITTILHEHTISAILPAVEKVDFNTPDEKRLQYEALDEYA